jgi:sporulation protein YlmC with PRC-barrel domain
MKTLTIAAALAALALSPAIADSTLPEVTDSGHPLIGEPPAPVRLSDPTDRAAAGQPSLQATLEASLMGMPVYDSDSNELGDVAAVLFAGDGTVDTLLVRMRAPSEVAGQKVALPFDLVTTTTGSDGRTMIVVATDGEEIHGAARFIGWR